MKVQIILSNYFQCIYNIPFSIIEYFKLSFSISIIRKQVKNIYLANRNNRKHPQTTVLKNYQLSKDSKDKQTNRRNINNTKKQMLQVKINEEKHQRQLFQLSQKDYLSYLQSLLPKEFFQLQDRLNQTFLESQNSSSNNLSFFNTKSYKHFNRSASNLSKSRFNSANSKRNMTLSQFILKLVKNISKLKYIDQYGQLQPITKQLGLDIKQLNKIDIEQSRIQFMLSSIDKGIQDQKKKVLYYSKTNLPSSINHNLKGSSDPQKPCSFVIPISNNANFKQNNFILNTESCQKIPSKYQSFIKQQNKKQIDNFAWLQINTKYPMLQKKVKSKLIQSINEDINEKKIRQLIYKKQNSKKIMNGSGFNQNSFNSTKQNALIDIEDQKVSLVNQSLFMEQFQKAKIDYIWTDKDQKMFVKNIKQVRKKCSNNSQFLKLCGRFKFISRGEFQTLASQEFSKMLNKNNKIYLSRQFLLDKYFSTTQLLTEQQMRFILKTSPMLSKCVDRNFIKTAIKNIKYQNISDLQLKIAEDIIARFQKLRNSVRASRKTYKQQANKVTKQRLANFQKHKQLQVARQMAKQQLKKHKIHLMRTLNYENRKSSAQIITKGLSKKTTSNIWTPLNKFHPSTGLFVKDCNQQCTDDLFNPYEKQYLKKIEETKIVPKKSISSKIQMMKFYTGGPDQAVLTNFIASQIDIKNICAVIKAHYFEKKILAAFQSIQISTPDIQLTRRQQSKPTTMEIKTKKTLNPSALEQDLQLIAKKKLFENRQKAKETVYVSKLLFLAAQNAFQSLRALNPQFTPDQINLKDKKGNTALYYASKHNNDDFVQFLMKFGANPNIKCQKQYTPLHLGFKSNNLSLILKLLTLSQVPPNLNSLNLDFKTPLAYCSRQILEKLNFEQGVISVDPNTPFISFDNNTLLQKQQFDKIKEESLQVVGQFTKRVKQSKFNIKCTQPLPSIQNLNLQ